MQTWFFSPSCHPITTHGVALAFYLRVLESSVSQPSPIFLDNMLNRAIDGNVFGFSWKYFFIIVYCQTGMLTREWQITIRFSWEPGRGNATIFFPSHYAMFQRKFTGWACEFVNYFCSSAFPFRYPNQWFYHLSYICFCSSSFPTRHPNHWYHSTICSLLPKVRWVKPVKPLQWIH